MDWVDNRFTVRALRPHTCFTVSRLVPDQNPRLTDVVITVRTGAQYGIVYRHGVPVGAAAYYLDTTTGVVTLCQTPPL